MESVPHIDVVHCESTPCQDHSERGISSNKQKGRGLIKQDSRSDHLIVAIPYSNENVADNIFGDAERAPALEGLFESARGVEECRYGGRHVCDHYVLSGLLRLFCGMKEWKERGRGRGGKGREGEG